MPNRAKFPINHVTFGHGTVLFRLLTGKFVDVRSRQISLLERPLTIPRDKAPSLR